MVGVLTLWYNSQTGYHGRLYVGLRRLWRVFLPISGLKTSTRVSSPTVPSLYFGSARLLPVAEIEVVAEGKTFQRRRRPTKSRDKHQRQIVSKPGLPQIRAIPLTDRVTRRRIDIGDM